MIHIAGRISCEEIRARDPEATGATVLRELAPATCYVLPRPIFLDTDHASVRARGLLGAYFSNRYAKAGGITLIEAANAFVVGQGAVVTRQRLLITESVTEFLGLGLLPDGCVLTDAGLAVASREGGRLRGRCLLVKRPWYNNYGHWLVDLLPILGIVRDAGLAIDRIIFGDPHVPALKSLMQTAAERIFPGTPYSFIGDAEPTRVERLYYVSPVHLPPLGKHPAAVAQLHDYGIGRMGEGPASERVFVSRRSALRTIRNEDEVGHVLAAHDFTTVFPEELAFADQVATFHAAKVVVGIKGAALTNAVFCRPGAAVLVLSPSDFPDPFFWDLVAPRGIDYGELFGRTIGDDGHPSHVDFTVDPDKLDVALAAVIGRRDGHEKAAQ